ncbi:uncharacterized protein LOC107042630 [Diachasma alloeum]|uniref:uncharacterized protein LOC107042630 n=1 Tax=Diachasma alloeum TaxID=454923 RepID=UPI00073836DE|nr:uncharacterized protein LOC107042630 [Diachasma alloeum]XP_015119245.1 uncharacterized protein LOC107042630 [Diachasma alloeum]
MPRKDRSRSDRAPGSEATCVFCSSSEDNELKYGKIHKYNGITTHYYCLLLSSNMQQKGGDDEGILGFLTLDILNELKRGKRLSCSYCKKIGATLGCCNTKCKKIFHLPCGLKSGSLHQFFGEFRSYCVNHRPKQKIDEKIKAQISDQLLCYICYDNVDRNNLFETLWAPCCKKNAWFHRLCVQQLAMSAGYFFKCPLCNNKKEFQKAMLDNGIFIPCQDASWELVPNAFQELLYRHNRCDASQCICSKGRRYTSSNPKWELILCRTCGSQGIHVACGRLKWGNATWDCRECTSILTKTAQENSEESRMSDNSTPSLNPSTKDDSCHSDSDGSDSDISVGVEEPVYGPTPWPANPDTPPQTAIRPGPRSFKLKQEKMLRATCDVSSEGTSSEASSPHSESSRGLFGENRRGRTTADSSSSTIDRVNQGTSRTPSSSIASSQPTPKTLPGRSNSPEELVIIDSDEESFPEKSAPPISNITEDVLMTNNEINIPIHHVPSSLPNGLRILGDTRPPTPRANLPVIEATYISADILGNQSIGHIAVGPSHDPVILGNIQMPTQLPPLPSAISFTNQAIFRPQEQLYPVAPIYPNADHVPESPVMNIQITNVTSLPLEEFAGESEAQNVPVSSTLDTTPEVVDVESDNEEINYHLSMAQQLRQANFNVANQQMNREKRPAPVMPVQQNAVDPNNSVPNVVSADPKRPRTDCPLEVPQITTDEPTDSSDNPYGRGVSLENAAIVKVMGKEFVLPLADEARVKVNSTWQPEYDGDAGTKPADETPEPITRCRSHRIYSMEIPSRGTGAESCYESKSASGDAIAESDAASINTRAGITTASDHSNRLKLLNSISLKDLKFRVCENNTLKMTVNDVFTMNLDLDTGQKRRPGPKSAVERWRRNGSSLVRRSSSTYYESRIKLEMNCTKSPTRETTLAMNISKLFKSPERRKVNALKENLAPLVAETNTVSYSPSPERKVKRVRLDNDGAIHYDSRQRQVKCLANLLNEQDHAGTSRDDLKLSHSLIDQTSKSLNRHKSRGTFGVNSPVNEDKEGFPVSIELSRIQPLLLSKSALFEGNDELLARGLVKFHSISDLRCYPSIENHSKGILRRSRSLNSLLLSSGSEIFDINVNDNRINLQRRGKKRKARSFEKHNCMR